MKQLSVMISGGGSNLKAIIDAIHAGRLPANIVRVIADRDCSGKHHALDADIPFTLIDRKLDRYTFASELTQAVPETTDLIVLAGFLSVIPAALVEKYPRKIINLHPSLLPKFGGMGMYGMNVHRAVIAAGEAESGCSVHYVDLGVDTGEIIAQAKVPVLANDSPEALQQRIAPEEHRLLVKTIAGLLA